MTKEWELKNKRYKDNNFLIETKNFDETKNFIFVKGHFFDCENPKFFSQDLSIFIKNYKLLNFLIFKFNLRKTSKAK